MATSLMLFAEFTAGLLVASEIPTEPGLHREIKVEGQRHRLHHYIPETFPLPVGAAAKQMSEAQRQGLEGTRDSQLRDAAVQRSFERYQRFEALVDQERRAGLKVEQLQKIEAEYRSLAEGPADRWQELAQKRAEALAKIIASNPRRVGQ